jgi:uncharacterized protein (TIGR01777 family)
VSSRRFTWRSSLPHPANEVFSWYERVGAFERLNAPWRPVSVVSPPQPLALGTEVEIRVPVVGPISVPWRLRHSLFVKDQAFRDEQVAGPFKTWRHDHRFIVEGVDSSEMLDEIEYSLPWFGGLANFQVQRELTRLFAHRHAVLRHDLALHARWKDMPRKTVLIAGASGFIGSALRAFLSTAGHEVISLVRRPARSASERSWHPERKELSPSVFDGIDIVINLGGENIAAGRWSAARKTLLWKSRTEGTSLLAETIASLERKPELAIMGSAIGFYGDRGSAPLDEQAPVGSGFLAELAKAWENAAAPIADSGCRLVSIRTGTVLNIAGGALSKMVPPFLAGVGGPLGNGQQYMSWIGLEDFLGAIEHIMYTPSLDGPINMVSPNPCTNEYFCETLGQVLRRPSWLRMPAGVLKAIFGEMADATLLASARITPSRLISFSYQFVTPNLPEALVFECGMSHRA